MLQNRNYHMNKNHHADSLWLVQTRSFPTVLLALGPLSACQRHAWCLLSTFLCACSVLRVTAEPLHSEMGMTDPLRLSAGESLTDLCPWFCTHHLHGSASVLAETLDSQSRCVRDMLTRTTRKRMQEEQIKAAEVLLVDQTTSRHPVRWLSKWNIISVHYGEAELADHKWHAMSILVCENMMEICSS